MVTRHGLGGGDDQELGRSLLAFTNENVSNF